MVKPLYAFVDWGVKNMTLRRLFGRISEVCADVPMPIVLMIDEVDSASNNQVFIGSHAQLRAHCPDRGNSPILQSVILASVYDVTNLKFKIRSDKEYKFNSPWNIAA